MANFKPCVLMLDTEVESRGDLATAIVEAGFEVRRESSSGGGISQVLEVDPDVILMSEEMPPLDGVLMLSLLRRMTMAPIIVVGSKGESAAVDALLQGADMYVAEPVRQRELVARVRALVRRHRAGEKDDFWRGGRRKAGGGALRDLARLWSLFTGRRPSVSWMQLLFVMVVGLAVLLTTVSVIQDARIGDLEERVTTFETVRIEVVAPTEDSG